jgi:hypothetical protein
MRLVTAMLVVVMLAGVGVQAADAQAMGFKIGATFSKMDVEDVADDVLDQITSFGGGAFIRFGLSSFAIQAEVLGITKGFEVEDVVGDANTRLELTYVDVPLIAMFEVGDGPYIFAGPVVAFEVDCKTSLGDVSRDCDETDGKRKETDFALVGGAGIHLPVGPGAFLIEARFTLGLVNLNENTAVGQDGSMKSRYWGIFAGYAFPIGN